MCRAVYAVIVAADEGAAARLRRAAGLEVQVMDVVVGSGPLPAGPFDVVVVSGVDRALLAGMRAAAPEAAFVWVGDDGPVEAHASITEDALDELPAVIVRALLARSR